ncbi:MAG: O-antigen ligase family protein [Myxococcales bacterium]|nr:O-antigen ligase family protein [Myxococcales bacterium]MBL0193404.1 O-antigen ligase family protein [Myxococcales bacterium]
MDGTTDGHGRTTRAAKVAFVLGIASCGLALGSIHTYALAVSAALIALAFGLCYLPDAAPLRPRVSASMLVLLAVGLVVYTAVTALPLPASLVRLIAPANADIWERCLRGFGSPGPGTVSMSLDPQATRVEVLRGLTYLLAFATALRFTTRRGGVAFLERVVIGCALFMAAASILHPVLGAERVLGVYRPEYDYGKHLAPILNGNHLAGYLNLGLATGLGVMAMTRSARERVLLAGCCLFLLGMEFYIASRGGIATSALSAVIVGLVAYRARRGGRTAAAAGGPMLLVLAAGVGVGLLILAGSEEARGELSSKDTTKLDPILQSLAMIRPHGVFGVGRGAFESTFPAYRTSGGFITMTHPENVVAQVVVEWGLPCAAIFFGVLLLALRPRWVLAHPTKAPVGAYAALIGLCVHNLVDFSSELPGVMVLAATCAAIATGREAEGGAIPKWARHPRVAAGAALLATGLAAFAAVRGAPGGLYPDRETVGKLATDRTASRAQFDAALRGAILRHPGEPYFFYAAAVRGQALRDGPVLAWAGHALERSPIYGPVHLILARLFARTVPSQARVEYRLALEQDGGGDSWGQEVSRLVRDYDDAVELLPIGPYRRDAIEWIATEVELRLPATRAGLDEDALALDPAATGPLRRHARDALSDVRDAAIWCKGRECIDRGAAFAGRLREAAPTECDGYALGAELRAAGGDPQGAVRDLEAATDRVSDRSLCLVRLVELMESTGLTEQVDSAITRVANAGCSSPKDCAENFAFAGAFYLGRGSPRRAVAFYRKAIDSAPERDEYLLEYARLTASLELHAETLHAFTLLRERHPEVPEYAERAEAARAEVSKSRFTPPPEPPAPAP